MAEAYAGLGDETRAKKLFDSAKAEPGVEDWMIHTTEEQLKSLKDLLAKSPLSRITPSMVA